MILGKSYEKLFSIWFTHSDYPNSGLSGGVLTDMMKLEFDDLTKAFFMENDIQCRFKNDMILVIIRVNPETGIPFHSLPKKISMRFYLNLNKNLFKKIEISEKFTIDKPYPIRINLRSSIETIRLSFLEPKEIEERQPVHVYHPGFPGFWESNTVSVKRCFAVIDIVTEGSSSHRLFTDDQNTLFYSSLLGNFDEHLCNIQLKN